MEQQLELNAEELWTDVSSRLREALNETTYKTWFGAHPLTNNTPASSVSETPVPVLPTVSRPRPLAPRSAWRRSSIICLRPACRPLPLRM